MSAKKYRFFGQVSWVNDLGQEADAGWSCFATWAKWEDYARLQAENERLRKWMDEIHSVSKKCLSTGQYMNYQLYEIVKEYEAAKEGKPSV